MADDGLLCFTEKGVKVTSTGRKFVRNICSAFDLFLKPCSNEKLFSKAI